MEITAYLASALIGISLGLIGGGGSILTVPVLVYLFDVNPLLATSYSLFIVGVTSTFGAYQNFRKNLINIKTALLFGVSSIITAFIIRKFFISLIPAHLFSIAGFQVTSTLMTMLLFALLMIAASFSMIHERKSPKPGLFIRYRTFKLLLYGIGVGLTTGFLGAGGGFLLIPALVILLGLPMKEAIGTSLMIIALNALVGFAGDLGHFKINWPFLLKVTAFAMAGIFIGTFLSTKVDGGKLKKGFGWFVLIMGAFIILKELFLNLNNHTIKHMLDLLKQPWPWYTSGVAIALIMLLLLYFGKFFGVSSNLRTICTIAGAGKKVKFFDFDWKTQKWNLLFIFGAILGGLISSTLLNNHQPLQLSGATVADLKDIGIVFDGNLNPSQLFSLDAIFSIKGFLMLLSGGILVGFGTRYAGGCTSGHAISGLSNLQLPSLIAVVGFFIGGLAMTYFIMPHLF